MKKAKKESKKGKNLNFKSIMISPKDIRKIEIKRALSGEISPLTIGRLQVLLINLSFSLSKY